MYKAIPKNRLKMYDKGQVVILVGTETSQKLTITSIREDGLYELTNEKGRLVITAAACHEVK